MEIRKDYIAFYRKYRPKKFSDIVGQKFLLESLKNIIKSGNFFHAYLFSGPHGTGKTTVAKIFANAINCTHKTDLIEPCQNCIKNFNNSLDIIEMDAASHNGVKEIREIIENSINFPQISPYKIYILDEVHMLSTSAFNAFLKTLEEPPKHMIFILATTEVHKIPLTILSRVQRYNFLALKEDEICHRLEFILEKEKIKYEKNALKSVFLLSQGSLRDAISILEQVATFGSGYVNQKNINELFGLVNKEILVNFVNALFLADSKISYEILEQISFQSKNFQLFLESLINLVKEWIIWKSTKTNELLEFYSNFDLENLKISQDFAFKFLEIAFSSLKDINFADFQNLTLEIFIMRILSLSNLEISDQNNIKFKKLEENKVDKSDIPEKITEKVSEIKSSPANFYKIEDRLEKLGKLDLKNLEEDMQTKQNKNYSSIFNRKLEQNLEKSPLKTGVFSKSTTEFNQFGQIGNPFIETENHKKIENQNLKNNGEFDGEIDFSNSFMPKNGTKIDENINSVSDFSDISANLSENKTNFAQSFNNKDTNLINLDTNFGNNSSKFLKKIDSKDYLSAEEVLNFIWLGKNFRSQNQVEYENLVQNWKKNLPLFEYNVEFMEIVSVLKYAEILSLGANFVFFMAARDEYEDLLIETIKEKYQVNELLLQIFNVEMHPLVASKNLINKTKILPTKMRNEGKRIVAKPFEIPKKTTISKEDLEKLFFDK
ncbi:DNA polymerase III subunit gamma/tau [Mesomycoplasma hyopneumoniae]|uniref:DNA polymerase III subunit gamma/tau n=2 Tax=Mesomycoplasma hyopneumoniae TaxID=2099 RepID=UPI00136F9ABD|nr:DNA polymerase III subunit gamma/tau [Mesomycoplasma hyopneumoniae]MXR44335.1 DNA polymerase III subunit gamma/tau [Mesomycoplasma hyopneumoniae]MXR57255.1 DNA polymerase III subunit gamma/tau [Mesomycoplasma hyopneumoniae]